MSSSSSSSKSEYGFVMHPDYMCEAKRAQTFRNNWPPHLPQTPEELAAAGFFYYNNNNKLKADYVICFVCNLGLKHWSVEDNPLEMHAMFGSECKYLQMRAGSEFIKQILRRKLEEPWTFLTPAIDDDEDRLVCKICYSHELNTAFVPCGHTMCNLCSLKFQKCPICREKVEKIIRIYIQ